MSPHTTEKTYKTLADVPGASSDFGNLSVTAPPEGAPVEARLHVWAPVEGLATGIGSVEGDNLEITVSAEMYQSGGGVWLRALVDGRVAQPSDVLFKSGNVKFDGVRSFTFVQEGVSGGQHLVEVQMRTGSPASIRDRVLTVHSGSLFQGSSRIAVASAPSGPHIKATSQYKDIPGLLTVISTEVPSTLAITFSAEARAVSGRMMVRAVVNGVEVGEVIFAEAGDAQRDGTRSYTFVMPTLPGGEHQVKLQWRSGSGVSQIGDRTMSVSAVHLGSQRVIAVTPSNPVALTQTNWVDLSNASTIETTESVSNIAISVSTEVLSQQGRVFLRVLLDGQPASPSDVTLIQGGPKWRATAHTFVVKNVGRGRHRVRVQIRVDPGTTAKFRRRSVRLLWKRRRGPDFVQPFLGMNPLVRRFRLLVIGFDPVRPGHTRPSFAQIRNTFEGNPGHVAENLNFLQPDPERGPNLRDWLMENSGGVATLGQVRYVGCRDDQWYVAPPERQGNWYWDNAAWDQMWKDALSQADAEVDFHSYDTDQSNRISSDELVVAIVRPQNDAYGTLRGANAFLDGSSTALNVPILDLYLSSNPAQFRAGVGIAAHEFAHHVFGAVDLYGNCSAISPGPYSVMDEHWGATHLDPFEKMKNGMVQPWAINLDSIAIALGVVLSSVELSHQVLLLHDVARVAREYFLIENRYPGGPLQPNYDSPSLPFGAIVIWQIFEDLQLVHTSAICPEDPRFIRKIKTISSPGNFFDLTWSDGSPTGFRLTAPIANAEIAQIMLERM